MNIYKNMTFLINHFNMLQLNNIHEYGFHNQESQKDKEHQSHPTDVKIQY